MADIIRPVVLSPPLAAFVWRMIQGHPGIPGAELAVAAAVVAAIEAATQPEPPPPEPAPDV